MGSTVALEYQRPASRTHWGYPRQGQEGREESPRREASSRWTLSNETSILDHVSPALMRTPLGCSQPHRTGHGFSLGLPDNSSSGTMMLAPSGVRHAPCPKGGKLANECWRFPPRTDKIALKGVQDPFKGSGANPAGVARTTSIETRPSKEPLFEPQCSNRGSGATVEDVNRGYHSQHSQ